MKILSFGEILFDIYENVSVLGGAPLNFAAHAALQGAENYLLSSVGKDALGKKALEKIKEFKISTEYIAVLPDKETGKSVVTLDTNGVPTYDLIKNVAYDHIPFPNHLKNDRFDILAFGTLALREKNNFKTLENVLSENICKKVYTDLNIRPPFYSKKSILFCLENANIVKISDEELPLVTEEVFGKTIDLDKAIIKLSEHFCNIEQILITCGEKGAYAYCKKTGKTYFCEAQKTKVVSTVGAGDSFGATFLVQYFKSKNILDSMKKAALVSAFVISEKGAVPDKTVEVIKKYFL